MKYKRIKTKHNVIILWFVLIFDNGKECRDHYEVKKERQVTFKRYRKWLHIPKVVTK